MAQRVGMPAKECAGGGCKGAGQRGGDRAGLMASNQGSNHPRISVLNRASGSANTRCPWRDARPCRHAWKESYRPGSRGLLRIVELEAGRVSTILLGGFRRRAAFHGRVMAAATIAVGMGGSICGWQQRALQGLQRALQAWMAASSRSPAFTAEIGEAIPRHALRVLLADTRIPRLRVDMRTGGPEAWRTGGLAGRLADGPPGGARWTEWWTDWRTGRLADWRIRKYSRKDSPGGA